MAYLIIRFYPTESMSGSDFFNTIDGLDIDFYDISFNNLNPTSALLSITNSAGIQQNGSDAVATGVFSLSTGSAEFDSIDLRVVVKRGGTTLLDTVLGYNIELESTDPDTGNRHKARPGAYIFLPPKDAKLSSLFPKPGEPWNYTNLWKALLNDSNMGDPNYDGVLFKETGNANYDLSTLTLGQCEHLAREIATGERDNYPPVPNKKNWKLYTADGSDPDEDVKEKFYTARTQLIADLESHQKKEEARTKELTHYIWALVCAAWAAKESRGVQDILFRFPIKLPNFGSEEINIVNLPLDTNFSPPQSYLSIPAQFFYAHGIEIPIEIGKEKRYEQIKTEEQDLLLTLFNKVEDNGIADLLATGKTFEQVIRLLRAQHTNRPSQPTFDLASNDYGNPDLKVEELITSWSNYSGQSSLDFWSGPLGVDDLEGHSELVMYLFSQGNIEFFNYLDGRFDDIEVASGPNSLLDISNDNIENTKDEWKTLYQDYLNDANTVIGDSGIDFLPPGTLEERKDYFAIYACDFFGNLSVASSEYTLNVTFHTPPEFSTEVGPIQKFFSNLASFADLNDPNITEPLIASCFPDDPCGHEWLRDKLTVFSNLYQITDGIGNNCLTDEIRLTVWETLFALGITERDQIQSMSLADFRACVKGTILEGNQYLTDDGGNPCDIGELIHGNVAVSIPPVEDKFIPVNSGDLINCIPPDYLAKTGRFAYLQELLNFQIGDKTVSDLLLETRNLSFENLMVSSENAEIKIPTIDVVNSLMEEMICNQASAVRTWDTQGFINLMTEFKAVTIPNKQSYFEDLGNVLPNNSLSGLILEFGTSTCNLTGIQTQIQALCDLLNTEKDAGNLNGLNDLISILVSHTNTNTFAPILLTFIQAMINMSPDQFDEESAQVLTAMGSLQGNAVIALLTYLIQVANHPSGIGNTRLFLSKAGEKANRGFYQEMVQSLLPASSSCAYEMLAESTKDPCKLPFHQPSTVSSAYLGVLGINRYDLARKFSQHIHGFAYDPGHVLPEFKSHLFRFPVNHALALEYLGISPQEYSLYYEQTPFPENADSVFHELLGYESATELSTYSNLGEFLKKNCLECCDWECWLRSGFNPLQIRDDNQKLVSFNCYDCDLFNYQIDVLQGGSDLAELTFPRLWYLTMLIRFSRQLKKVGISCYSCSDLVHIAEKLEWISIYYEDKDNNGVEELYTEINPHFLEQFVALDQLRKECGICFSIPADAPFPVYICHLLEGPSGANWEIALAYFVEKIVEKCNEGKAPEACRSPQFIKLLVDHIDMLALLAGFRSDDDECYRWYHQFTNIIRFAQVLCRICDSNFTVGQLQFIFTADGQLVGDDPYPQQTLNEAQECPFNLPDNVAEFDLESLREKLLNIELDQSEIDSWTWQKIEAHLSADFGYTGTGFLDMGKHFFPTMLETLGYTISNADLQFQEVLNQNDTAQLMWNTGDVQPFFYMPGFLTCKIPLKSSEVIQKLQTIRQLNGFEETAVQNLFFAPRQVLAPFAAFFDNFTEALSVLIETEGESSRWEYFQRNFALYYKKCQIITQHFTAQLSAELGIPNLDEQVTWKIIAHLFADDNQATQAWENDLGTSPTMTYPDKIHAGAFTALTKLTGTGLLGTFTDNSGNIIWREVRGGMSAYGSVENLNDSPVPAVIPNINYTPANTPLIAIVRNGYAHTNGSPSRILGGAQGYCAEYKGELYISESGNYTFRAGAPTGSGEIPDFDQAKHSQWQLTLTRGNKSWVVLDNDWDAPDTPGDCSVEMRLKKGTYRICFTFKQPEPSLQNMEDGCPQPTGWQIKWTTPYQSAWHTIPIANLYHKEPLGDLSLDTNFLHTTASEFLQDQYQASISAIRRTSIRVFAGGLLIHGSGISGESVSGYDKSELDYLLDNPTLFEGFSHYKNSGNWETHLAGFDLNLLPVRDNYCPPDIQVDQRVEPSITRIQAMFQWFEQSWEIKQLKSEAAEQGLDSVWMLWNACSQTPSDLPGHLNQYLGVDFDKAHLVTQLHAGFDLSCEELLNEEYTIRVWEMLKCIKAWLCKFSPATFLRVYPAQWVNIDFDSFGNENLISFIASGFTQGPITRLKELRAINDQIRLESRQALSCYINSLASDAVFSLDDLLLTDASVGLCDTASRLDIAIGMVQTFLNRINLGIENPDLSQPILFTNKEEQLWFNQYASFKTWQICKLRECYPENFVIHDILQEDSKSPGFRLLKEELKKDVLSVAVSGGISKLQGKKVPGMSTLMPLQQHIPSTISSNPPLTASPVVAGVAHWENAATAKELDFWVETVDKFNIPYLRVAAAGLPLAGISYGCKDTSCCNHCEGTLSYPVTEYYFGLLESKYYEDIQQTYQDWENDNNIIDLLYMKDLPVSFLCWSKIENGKAGAVQWSPIGIKSESDPVELIFKGRFGDSLWIEARNGITELEELYDGNGDPIEIAPGFRFDLVTEEVITLPKLGELLPDAFSFQDNPYYFLYHDLGAPRFPKTLEGTVYLIAKQLQSNCDFKGAKDWLDCVLYTFNRDNGWESNSDINTSERKALLMTYLDNLLTWSRHLHEQNTVESLNQAKMVLGLAGKILGERPTEINALQFAPVSLADFEPFAPGTNPGLLCLYDEYLSQTHLLEYCLDQQGQSCYSIADKDLISGCITQICCHPQKLCVPESPYRFLSLINRAKEYANALTALGNSLQSAIEKGDQERLTILREVQSNQLTQLNVEMKQNLVREAHFQVKALEKTLEVTQTRLVHYQNLITVGLIAQEQDYISLTQQSMVAQAASQGLQAVAQFVVLLAEIFPPLFTDAGGGSKTSASIQGGAAVASAISGILQTRAGLKSNDGGNFRREQDWILQRNAFIIEIEQIKNQLVAARLRLRNAQKDLDTYQVQIDHSKQTLKYLRDKFTNQEFYQWQEKELSILYYQLYECAMQVAIQAEKAYNVERCYSNEQFLQLPMWNNSYRGLLAGEHLSAALRNMEKRFFDTNHKMYELTKSISVYSEMPRAFLMIKYKGTSLIKLKEDLFAFDHPSHYCRVFKTISITIPCVVGPYVNVNASMKLRHSFVRVSPNILSTNCSDPRYADGYRMRENDDRFVFIAGGRESMATSKAVQDSGYHQLSFQNDQYLTFENAGIDAEFCFSLKQSNNRFDTGTITDIILETSYLAKEGGELYGKAASEAVRYRLPGNGELLINLPDHFPDAWYEMESGQENQYRLELGKIDFPFLSFQADLLISQIEFIIETDPCHECDVIEVVYKDEDCAHCDDVSIPCQRSALLGDKVFHGALQKEFPVSDKRMFLGNLCFPKDLEIRNVYLLVTYNAIPIYCMKEDEDCC